MFMENPATWTKAEHVVQKAMQQWQDGHDRGLIGLSQVRSITDALRREGLLTQKQSDSSED